MSRVLPTVKVKNPDVPGEAMIINESDFDEKVHELFDAPAEKPKNKRKGGKGDGNPDPDPLEGITFATPEAAAAAAAAGLTAADFTDEVAEGENGFDEIEVAEIVEFKASQA